jgi:hypothetical protein
MQSSSQQLLTCPTCGAALEERFGGEGGCMFCLLQAGIGSEEETVQDATRGALGGGTRFGVYEIDCHADGSLCELGRGAMGVTYRAPRLVPFARSCPVVGVKDSEIFLPRQVRISEGTGK